MKKEPWMLDFEAKFGYMARVLLILYEFNDMSHALSIIENHFVGLFDDVEDFGRFAFPIDDSDDDDNLLAYVDYEGYGEDLLKHGECLYFYTPESKIFVFTKFEAKFINY